MKKSKRAVRFMAESHRLDPEESLIELWYSSNGRLDYLRNPSSIVRGKDYYYVRTFFSNLAKRIRIGQNIDKAPRSVKVVIKSHDFSSIGRSSDSFSYLTTEEVIQIYDELVKDFSDNEDPIDPAGVKDHKVLESAIFHPQTSYEGFFKYPTIETAAAALMYAITHNHPFFNGNKRTSMVAMLVFLDRHNLSVTCGEDDLFKVSIELAKHKLVSSESLYPDSEIEALARWLHSNSKYVQRGERPISLRKFKQILGHFACQILPDGRVERTLRSKNLFGIPTTRTLTTRYTRIEPGPDGRQMNKKMVKSIREELELTNEFGIDSEQFYEMENLTVAEFINKYKKLLRRLGRL